MQIFLGLFPASEVSSGSTFHLALILTMPLIGLILWVSLAIIAYEFSKQVFGEEKDSLYRVRRQGQAKIVGLVLTVVFAISMIAVLALMAAVVFLAYRAGLDRGAYMNVISVALLWIGSPALVSSLLGVFLGKVAPRPIGYSLILMLLIFTTPLLGNLIGSRLAFDASSYILRLIFYWILVAPFELMAPFVTVMPDSIHLLPSGLHQWLLPLIWILSLLVGIGFSLRKNQSFSLLIVPLAFLFLITPWALYGNRIALPHFSEVSPRDIQETSLMLDLFDENSLGALHLYQTENIPTVARYTIDITVGDMLRGEVVMVLAEPFEEMPEFTLFRGYQVSSITDLEGRALDFSQEGDLIRILTSGQEKTTGFIFEYAGSGWGNYANRQGMFLPSTFPWYPWPGRQRFYWEGDIHSVNVSRHISRRGTVKEIQVRTNSPFAEILAPHGIAVASSEDYTFVPAESLTLMAGQVRRIGDAETLIFYGGDAILEWYDLAESSYNINTAQARQRILDEAHVLRDKMGLADIEMHIRTFVFVPTFPAYSNLYMFPVNQDGYILVDAGNMIDYSVALAFQDIPQIYEKRELYESLYRFLSDPEDHFFLNPGQGRNSEDGFPASIIGNLLTDLILVYDERYMVRRIVEHLKDECVVVTSEKFLLSLVDETE